LLTEARIAGWMHHLPPGKEEIINGQGQADEMLFQAHMIMQYASIVLHYPRSNLVSTLPAAAETPCNKKEKHFSPVSTQHTHAIKATESSIQLSNLATLPLPIRGHTPLFICGLVLSSIVQLSACSVLPQHQQEHYRDRINLIIGALKSLSQTWAVSQMVLQQIKKLAATVLTTHAQLSPAPFGSAANTAIDFSALSETIDPGDMDWTGIIGHEELQSLLFNGSEISYVPIA